MLNFIRAVIARWKSYQLTLNAAIAAMIAVIAPKTTSSQMDVGPRNELRTTQTPREQIAQLSNFTVLASLHSLKSNKGCYPGTTRRARWFYIPRGSRYSFSIFWQTLQ